VEGGLDSQEVVTEGGLTRARSSRLKRDTMRQRRRIRAGFAGSPCFRTDVQAIRDGCVKHTMGIDRLEGAAMFSC
jgi:hypothetical protein